MESGVQDFLPCTVVDLAYGWIMPSSGVRKGSVCYKPVFKVSIFFKCFNYYKWKIGQTTQTNYFFFWQSTSAIG